jgi:hypothetical protein
MIKDLSQQTKVYRASYWKDYDLFGQGKGTKVIYDPKKFGLDVMEYLVHCVNWESSGEINLDISQVQIHYCETEDNGSRRKIKILAPIEIWHQAKVEEERKWGEFMEE